MTNNFFHKIKLLQAAPKSPRQLQNELINILDDSFILEVVTLLIEEEKNEFTLRIRAKVQN